MKALNNLQKPFPVLARLATPKIFTWMGWGVVFAIASYFVLKNAVPFFTWTEETYGKHWSHAGWLLLHIFSGMLALAVGPFQFWTAFRRRYTRTHRMIGRVYLFSVLISALASVYLLTLPDSSFGFRIGISGLALAWISTTGLAYLAIRKRQIIQHQEWMIRSYVVTFGFVFFRMLLDPMLALQIVTPLEAIGAVSWLCWAPPLLITELVLQGRKIMRKQKDAPARAKRT